MKIGFAIERLDFRSGIVRVVSNIAFELKKNFNYDIYIISTGCDSEEKNKFLTDKNIGLVNLDIEKYGHRKKYIYYAGAINKALVNEYFDVIVVSGAEHVLFYSLGTSKLKSDAPKLFVWEHRNFSAGPKFRLEWLGKRYAIKNWDGVICITKKDADQYVKYAGSSDKINQIYNLSDFNGSRKPYNTESKKIISCGYLSRIKGFDMLVDIAKKVFEKHSDWIWDIYGEGTERDKLQMLINDKGLHNNVFLKGYATNINELYGDYSFFVLTSRAEGMGMVLIEAQKSGLPVVSFDIKCGPSDVITDGTNGYLIEPFDINDMASKVCDLIENEDKRKAFSYESEINLEEFEKEYIIKKWIQLLG